MLMCNETTTLVRHVRLAEGDFYTCCVLEGVSWYAKHGVSTSTAGQTPTEHVYCRIPETVLQQAGGVMPQRGDYITKGKVTSVTTAKEILSREDTFEIHSVGDNRRGRALRHVVVSNA